MFFAFVEVHKLFITVDTSVNEKEIHKLCGTHAMRFTISIFSLYFIKENESLVCKTLFSFTKVKTVVFEVFWVTQVKSEFTASEQPTEITIYKQNNTKARRVTLAAGKRFFLWVMRLVGHCFQRKC